MPVHVEIEHPDRNVVWLSPKFLEGDGHVMIAGVGNHLHIDDPLISGHPSFHLTGGAKVVVGKDCNLGWLELHALAPGVVVEIGSWTSFNGLSRITAHEPARITIGSGCLFGPDCVMAASDVHHVLHADTGERLNPPDDIVVGDHVWCGSRVAILRGSQIGHDSVVGFGSVVTGHFPPHVVLAGVPARIAKERVTWKF